MVSAILCSCRKALLMELSDYFNNLINGLALKSELEWKVSVNLVDMEGKPDAAIVT